MGADRGGDTRDGGRWDVEKAQTERLPDPARGSQWRAASPSASAPLAPPPTRQRLDTRSRPLTSPSAASRPLIVPAGRSRARGRPPSRAGSPAPPKAAHAPAQVPAPQAAAAGRLLRALRTPLALRVAQWVVALALVAGAVLALGAANQDAGPAGAAVRLWESRAGVRVMPPDVTPPGGWQAYDATKRAIIDKIAMAFGPDSRTAQDAVNVAWCESNFDPQARNSVAVGGSHAEGLFQILWPGTWNTTSQAAHSPFDPDANILAAHELWSRDGQSWVEWSCQP